MKALVMTAQDAREFEKLGGLTITKPIRPVPVTYCKGLHLMEREPGRWLLVGGDNDVDRAEKFSNWYRAPVKAGDIVFLREPWHRLIDPTTKEPSGRVILAADSTVAEGQTSYKWASPVSMPEDAARRFAVVSKVEPIYNENVAVWSITLEAVTKAAAEAGEAGALPYSDAPSPGEQTTLDAQEDEEVGSFTLGKCNYCGREWGVTLEGAKGGGYPTQRTANAAATRVCDCPEAVENRKPEVGVAFAVTTGACKYCGQLQEVGPHPSQAADETATEVCSCPSARTARRTAEQIEDARDRVNRLFGERAEDLGFKPIAGDGTIELLERVVELIARGPISSASLNIRGQCKAKFSITSKGKIKVSRSETRSCDLEAGE